MKMPQTEASSFLLDSSDWCNQRLYSIQSLIFLFLSELVFIFVLFVAAIFGAHQVATARHTECGSLENAIPNFIIMYISFSCQIAEKGIRVTILITFFTYKNAFYVLSLPLLFLQINNELIPPLCLPLHIFFCVPYF